MFDFLKRKEREIENNIKYGSDDVFIIIEGKKYKLKVNSIQVFNKAIEMQKKVSDLELELGQSPDGINKIIATIKDFLLMMFGPESYENIFDTDEKKDDYYWHLVLFSEVFSKILEFKANQFNNIVNSPMLEKLKKLQESKVGI